MGFEVVVIDGPAIVAVAGAAFVLGRDSGSVCRQFTCVASAVIYGIDSIDDISGWETHCHVHQGPQMA
jgi:hypothetical protein